MKLTLKALFVVILSACLAGNAMALSITLSDGFNTATIADGDADDINLLDGAVTYNGSIGTWLMSVTTGLSDPLIGSETFPILHLDSVDVSSANAGTLSITITDTYASSEDLTGIFGFYFSTGGVTSGTIDFQVSINGTIIDLEWDELSKLGSAFSGSESLSYLPTGSDLFELSIIATITHFGSTAETTSFNAEVAPVPEPATMLLLGIGLIGLAGFSRKKTLKKN